MTESTEPTQPTEPATAPRPAGSAQSTEPAGATGPAERREPRPVIERIGLAAVALVLALLFGVVSAASWVGGELFLAGMAGIGCLMTIWVGAMTLLRG